MDRDQELNDTEVEVQPEVEQTTQEEQITEPVEDYSEKLDSAETEADAIAAFNEAMGIDDETIPVEEPVEEVKEPVEAEAVDTPTEETSSHIFDLRDGDIELSLNLSDEKEAKQAKMLMQQGLNYAGKTTELAKHRSFVQYAEEHGITLDDIQMMSDIKSGNKEAIAKIAKDSNVDVFDLDNDMGDNYQAKEVRLPQQADPMMDNIANEILANEEYRESFQKWFPTMPVEIQQAVTTDASVLNGVKEDIESGVFNDAMAQAYKYQRINGMDFGPAYTKAKSEFIAINQPDPVPEVTRLDKQRASAPRSGGGSTPSNRGGYSPGVISDMSDEDFLKNYNDIIASVQGQR